MRFEYDDNELDILDSELPEDDNCVLNYCKSMAGHTIMIDPRFELIPSNVPNVYTIQKLTPSTSKREK